MSMSSWPPARYTRMRLEKWVLETAMPPPGAGAIANRFSSMYSMPTGEATGSTNPPVGLPS